MLTYDDLGLENKDHINRSEVKESEVIYRYFDKIEKEVSSYITSITRKLSDSVFKEISLINQSGVYDDYYHLSSYNLKSIIEKQLKDKKKKITFKIVWITKADSNDRKDINKLYKDITKEFTSVYFKNKSSDFEITYYLTKNVEGVFYLQFSHPIIYD